MPEPLGRLEVVVAVGRAGAASDHGGLVQRPAQRRRALSTQAPGRAALIGLIDGDVAGLEQLFVALGIPVTDDQPPTGVVMPPMDEIVRLFAGYGVGIIGPPPTLDQL